VLGAIGFGTVGAAAWMSSAAIASGGGIVSGSVVSVLTSLGKVGTPFVLGAIGFGTIGVTAGSYAAAWMSSAAIASGGGIVSGSAVSVLTSLGKVGSSLWRL
uniref:Uncharacterized protein n=1 Tax=Cynoglossus semilaevis TaxID=244447 RepID=A0A3P8UIP9_CYNSE